MKKLIPFFFLLLATKIYSQNSLNTELLIGCWTDSREENSEETHFFRPCDYKEFPRSRFRFKMVLKENNQCEWLYLHPSDMHSMKGGTWQLDKDLKTLSIYNLDGIIVKEFEVTDFNNQLLTFKKN